MLMKLRGGVRCFIYALHSSIAGYNEAMIVSIQSLEGRFHLTDKQTRPSSWNLKHGTALYRFQSYLYNVPNPVKCMTTCRGTQ